MKRRRARPPSLFDAPLSDPGAPAAKEHAHPQPTEHAAQLAALPNSGTQRRRVLEMIAERARTDEELSVDGHLSPSSVRPRRVELVEGGWVQDSGERRASAYGQPMIVWELTPRAREELR